MPTFSALIRPMRNARILTLVLITAGMSAPSRAGFVLPAPTGRFGVGTTSWHVSDPSRFESFTAARQPRQVKVTAWYPAANATATRAGNRAPYLRETIVEARTFGSLLRAPAAFDELADVQTHAFLDDVLLPGAARLPLLVFSHGYTGLVSAYTALLEDLASHGYIVLSIAHPYEVAATSLSNGTVVTMLDSSGAPLKGIQDVFAEWHDEDSTMARVTRAGSDANQLRILRAYVSKVRKTGAVIDRWVRDTKLVLDNLPALPASTTAGELARRVDMTRLGVFGHSMGGVVAGQFCVDDARCRAGLNLDGIPQSGTMIDAKMKRPFLMVYSARPGRLGASDVIYRQAALRYYRVDVDGTRHADFSDMIYWQGFRAVGATGTIAPDRATELTRIIVRQYFDQELRGVKSPLLNGTLALPDARVHRAQ